jgi:hypothetical protein
MQQQLSQFFVLYRRLPNHRKPIFHQQAQDVPGIAFIRPLPARNRGVNRARIVQRSLLF